MLQVCVISLLSRESENTGFSNHDENNIVCNKGQYRLLFCYVNVLHYVFAALDHDIVGAICNQTENVPLHVKGTPKG